MNATAVRPRQRRAYALDDDPPVKSQERPIAPPGALQELRYRQAERDLRAFVPLFWPVVEPSIPFIPNWHIDSICDHLMAASVGHIRRLIINIPPRHTKTDLVSVFWPAWEWVQWPHIKTIATSLGDSNALASSVKMRRLIEHDLYRNRWGDRFYLLGDQNTKSFFENDRGGKMLTMSLTSDPAGKGADKINFDDPNGLMDQDNLDELDRSWRKVQAYMDRLNQPTRGVFVLVQQRVSDLDVTARFLLAEQREQGWTHLCLPTEFEGRKRCVTLGATVRPVPLNDPKAVKSPWGKQRQFKVCGYARTDFSDPRTQEGELLNPLRFPPEEIERLKDPILGKGDYAFAAQHQQDPAPREGALFPRTSFRRYTCPPVDKLGRLQVEEWIQSWDMAFKELETSDFVVGTVWVRAGANFYLVDVSRARRSASKTLEAVRALSTKWPLTTRKLVEDKANGTAVVDMLTKGSGAIPGLQLVEPLGGKESRANAVEPLVAAGNVWVPDYEKGCKWPDGKGNYVPHDTRWVEVFLRECERFPMGQQDDQVDSMTQALNWWLPRLRFGAVPTGVAQVSAWRGPR